MVLQVADAAMPSATAKEKWEDDWARKECLNTDGSDSKTILDLRNVENGRRAPLFDQYENHSRRSFHQGESHASEIDPF